MAAPLPPEAVSVLEEGRQAYLAVPSAGGPHVTPELYAWSGGKLWLAFASSTLKAKVLAKDPEACALVMTTGRAVVVKGEVELFDARHPATILGAASRLPAAARATTRFTVRNAPDLLGFVTDTTRGRIGWRPPPLRVLAALTPASTLLLEDDSVTSGTGWWHGVTTDVFPVPPAGGRSVVAAFEGPAAVPATWFEDEHRLHVAPDLLDLLGLSGRFPLSIVTDRYGAPGPAAKQGSLLRGDGRRSGRSGSIDLHPELVVEWDGLLTTRVTVDLTA
jgi:hypothetical protein